MFAKSRDKRFTDKTLEVSKFIKIWAFIFARKSKLSVCIAGDYANCVINIFQFFHHHHHYYCHYQPEKICLSKYVTLSRVRIGLNGLTVSSYSYCPQAPEAV